MKMAITSEFSSAFYSSAMLMRCNNLLKENLLTYFLFISNISFLCPQGWAVIGKKNAIFLSFSDPTQVEQALAPCPPTFIPDVTLANLSGCNQATIGKRALLALGLETKEKQIGGCLESSTYFGFPISLPSDFHYFCNGNWSLVSGLSVHTPNVRSLLEQTSGWIWSYWSWFGSLTAKENIPTPPVSMLKSRALTMCPCSDEVWDSQATKQLCAGHTQHPIEIALVNHSSRSIFDPQLYCPLHLLLGAALY